MAVEKKKHTIVSASTGATYEAVEAKPASDVGAAKGKRIGAVILWIVAIAFEVVAVLVLFSKINITFINPLVLMIIALVLDLICVIIGSQLWKKANHIDPASKKNKVKFWLWNNMGLIVAAFAFIPFVILALTNKEADKKTKTVAVVVAVIALLIGSLFSLDWNPISAEEKAEAEAVFGTQNVYWTQFGSVYHSSPDCSHLNHSDTLIEGTVDQAIEANKSRLCKTCEQRDHIDLNKEAEPPVSSDADTDVNKVLTEADTNDNVINFD